MERRRLNMGIDEVKAKVRDSFLSWVIASRIRRRRYRKSFRIMKYVLILNRLLRGTYQRVLQLTLSRWLRRSKWPLIEKLFRKNTLYKRLISLVNYISSRDHIKQNMKISAYHLQKLYFHRFRSQYLRFLSIIRRSNNFQNVFKSKRMFIVIRSFSNLRNRRCDEFVQLESSDRFRKKRLLSKFLISLRKKCKAGFRRYQMSIIIRLSKLTRFFSAFRVLYLKNNRNVTDFPRFFLIKLMKRGFQAFKTIFFRCIIHEHAIEIAEEQFLMQYCKKFIKRNKMVIHLRDQMNMSVFFYERRCVCVFLKKLRKIKNETKRKCSARLHVNYFRAFQKLTNYSNNHYKFQININRACLRSTLMAFSYALKKWIMFKNDRISLSFRYKLFRLFCIKQSCSQKSISFSKFKKNCAISIISLVKKSEKCRNAISFCTLRSTLLRWKMVMLENRIKVKFMRNTFIKIRTLVVNQNLRKESVTAQDLHRGKHRQTLCQIAIAAAMVVSEKLRVEETIKQHRLRVIFMYWNSLNRSIIRQVSNCYRFNMMTLFFANWKWKCHERYMSYALKCKTSDFRSRTNVPEIHLRHLSSISKHLFIINSSKSTKFIKKTKPSSEIMGRKTLQSSQRTEVGLILNINKELPKYSYRKSFDDSICKRAKSRGSSLSTTSPKRTAVKDVHYNSSLP